MFTGTVVVMVTVVNRFGVGPASDPATAEINGTYMIQSHNNYCIIYLCMMFAHTYIHT